MKNEVFLKEVIALQRKDVEFLQTEVSSKDKFIDILATKKPSSDDTVGQITLSTGENIEYREVTNQKKNNKRLMKGWTKVTGR